MWRAIYLAKLPTWPQRVRVGVGWVLDALAGREIATLPGAVAAAPLTRKGSSNEKAKEPAAQRAR
jgi:hypothetical protein